MSFVDGNLSAADVAAVTGGNRDGFGFGGDGGFWLLILFLFAMMGGWGNNNNGYGNNGGVAVVPAVQAGFDQAAVMNGINGITASINTGFANAEVSRCNTLANLTNQMNAIAMAQQNCCCENRAAVADLKYTVATEACADRQAVTDALRDVQMGATANTNAILAAIQSGFQGVQDKLCQQEIDNLKTQNENLRTQINLQALQASQAEQTAKFMADNSAQTQALIQTLDPTAKPAYIVPNPNVGFGYGGPCCGYSAVA